MEQKVTRSREIETGIRHLCQSSSKWVSSSNQGLIRQRKRGMGSAFHLLWLGYSGPLTITALLLEAFILTLTYVLRHGWLVGCFGLNRPLRQYFSLYRAVSQREGERKEK